MLLVAIGFMNGMVRILDSLSLEDCTAQPFNNTHREAITHITFSHNCEYFATAVSRTFSSGKRHCDTVRARISKGDGGISPHCYYVSPTLGMSVASPRGTGFVPGTEIFLCINYSKSSVKKGNTSVGLLQHCFLFV